MCCCSTDPKYIVRMLLRITLGFSLAFVGFTHYRDPEFAVQVGAGLGALGPIGYVWGFVLPGLYIFGGLLLAFGIFPAAAYAAGIALASIPAGLLLKSAMGTLPLESSMPAALNAFIWLLVLAFSLPRCCCSPKSMPSITSVPASRPAPPPPVMKSTPPAPVAVTTKPEVKKTPIKKTAVKKVAPKPAVSKSIPVKKSAPPPAPESGLEL